jgi:predicted dehydrogenase
LFYASHTLGPLLVLMDDRATSVVGMNTGCKTAPDLGTIDVESCLMQTEKGAVIRLTNGFSVAHPMATHYSIAGTKGSLKMQRATGSTFVWYSEATDPPMKGWEEAPEEWLKRPDGESDTLVMIRDYVTSLLNDMPLPIDESRSMDFVLPGVFAHESAMQGGIKLEIPDLRE